MDLKDAKTAIDRYVAGDPALTRTYQRQTDGARRVLWLVLVAAAAPLG